MTRGSIDGLMDSIMTAGYCELAKELSISMFFDWPSIFRRHMPHIEWIQKEPIESMVVDVFCSRLTATLLMEAARKARETMTSPDKLVEHDDA